MEREGEADRRHPPPPPPLETLQLSITHTAPVSFLKPALGASAVREAWHLARGRVRITVTFPGKRQCILKEGSEREKGSAAASQEHAAHFIPER